MRYIPVHKRTGQRYPAITEQERAQKWSRPPYSRNFDFEPVADEKPTAKEPTEAKKANQETEQKEKGNLPA